MFIVLRIHSEECKRCRFLKRYRLKKRIPNEEKILLKNAAYFYVVTWYATQADASISSDVLDNYRFPTNRLIYLDPDLRNRELGFLPKVFPNIVFKNTVFKIFKEHKNELSDITLLLSDENGLWPACVGEIAPLFKSVEVYCEDENKYKDSCAKILQETGLSIHLKNQPFDLKEHKKCIVLEPSFEHRVFYKGRLLILEGQEMQEVVGENVELPPFYEDRRPCDLDKLLYASALFELCNQNSLTNLQYSSFSANKKTRIY